MALVEDFVAEVRAVTEVSTRVGLRIYPVVDAGQELPSMVYNWRGLSRDSYTIGSFGLRDSFVQLDIYSADYAEVNTLRNAILERFNNFAGQLNSNTTVSSCKVINTREELDNTNRAVFRAIIEIQILSD